MFPRYSLNRYLSLNHSVLTDKQSNISSREYKVVHDCMKTTFEIGLGPSLATAVQNV